MRRRREPGKDPVLSARSRLASAQRKDKNTPPEKLAELRAALSEARVERDIRDALYDPDPDFRLTAEARQRLAALLLNPEAVRNG